MSKIIWYLSFSDWLILFSIIFSRSIHTARKGKSFFFFSFLFLFIYLFLQLCRIPLRKCTTAFLSTHLLDGHFSCFQTLAVIIIGVMNLGVLGVLIFFPISVSGFLDYILRNGITYL